MTPIAERLVRGVSATAERNDGASAQSELFALGVMHAEIAFDAKGSVVVHSDFRGCHALRW